MNKGAIMAQRKPQPPKAVKECEEMVKKHHKQGKNITFTMYDEQAQEKTRVLPWKFNHIRQSYFGKVARSSKKDKKTTKPKSKVKAVASANSGTAGLSIRGTHDEVMEILKGLSSHKGAVSVTLI
jgi:hypothetical protein